MEEQTKIYALKTADKAEIVSTLIVARVAGVEFKGPPPIQVPDLVSGIAFCTDGYMIAYFVEDADQAPTFERDGKTVTGEYVDFDKFKDIVSGHLASKVLGVGASATREQIDAMRAEAATPCDDNAKFSIGPFLLPNGDKAGMQICPDCAQRFIAGRPGFDALYSSKYTVHILLSEVLRLHSLNKQTGTGASGMH